MDRANQTDSAVRRAAGEAFAGQHVHLIGVGGSGMRALAAVLLAQGASVSGSDNATSGALQRLTEHGATIHVGQRPQNIPIDCDLVVYSAAIHDQNPELLAARQRGCAVIKYSQMLGRVMSSKIGIAIAGTHGKSTTTGMVSYVLQRAGRDPSFIVGATVGQLGGPSGVGEGNHFVVEACEFDRSFLNLSPHYAAILNVEEDHLDCFKDLSAIVEAFGAFAARVPTDGALIANGEDRRVMEAISQATCEVETFGLADGCTWQGVNLQSIQGRPILEILYKGQPFGQLVCPLSGLHNAYNALAATGLLHHAGIESTVISELLPTFTGAHRRMTLKAQIGGVTVVDDFAHHPTEIQVTLRALRETFSPRRAICVFQPHQHSRTRFLLTDFARSFALADEVIVPDIYFVRDSAREKDNVSSADLVAEIRLHGGTAAYIDRFDRIVSHLKETLDEGDLLITMGAGDVWKVADDVIQWLGTSGHGE